MAAERQMNANLGGIEKRHLERYNISSKYCKDKKVIDVACGCGYGTNILSKVAENVFGGDYSIEAINYANKHWKNENIIYQQINIKDKPIIGVFDVFVSLETMEHISHELTETIKFYKSNLKKGGILITSHPENEDDIKINPYHFHFNITKEKMSQLLTDNGFKIIEVKIQEGYSGFHNYIIYIAELI